MPGYLVVENECHAAYSDDKAIATVTDNHKADKDFGCWYGGLCSRESATGQTQKVAGEKSAVMIRRTRGPEKEIGGGIDEV